MAVGFPTKDTFANGDIYSAGDVNDLAGTVNLLESAQYAAGKNKIINGDFRINQRNFTSGTNQSQYIADRIIGALSGGAGTTSRELFTLGQTEVPGNPLAFGKMVVTTGNDFARIIQRIENVSTFAGETATLSFYAKGVNPTTAGKLNVRLQQSFAGGSPGVATAEQDLILTPDWTRYSYTFAVPSISGKTLGSGGNDNLAVDIGQLSNTSTDGFTLEVAQIQLEAGSTASEFQTATGTIQGELAACQRYYYRLTPGTTGLRFGVGMTTSTTGHAILTQFPVSMRTKPTALEQTGTAADYSFIQGASVITSSSVPVFASATTEAGHTNLTSASGGIVGYGGMGRTASATAYLGWSAEL